MILVNGRFMTRRTTGVERAASSIFQHLRCHGDVAVAVPQALPPVAGHTWEQLVLPYKARGHVLWSPANFGPVLTTHQLLTLYDASVWDHPEWFSPRYRAWFTALVPRLVERVEAVMTISQFSRERIVEHLPGARRKMTVIPLATEGLRDVAKGPLPGNLGAGEFILTVGSLEPRKNLRRLLAAWNLISRTRGDMRLAIVGATSPTLKEVDHSVASQDGVCVLGNVTDSELAALYQACHGFVFASEYEGLGLPPIEAARYGCRIVASSLPPLRETLGDGPIYVDPLSTQSLASGLEALISDAHSGAATKMTLRLWTDVADDVYGVLQGLSC